MTISNELGGSQRNGLRLHPFGGQAGLNTYDRLISRTMKMSRTADIIADAAYLILSKPSTECTGNTFIDEDVLAAAGITDLEKYSLIPGAQLYKDLFV